MESNKNIETSRRPISIIIISVAVALVMLISYIVALSKFSDPSEDMDVSESSEVSLTSESTLPQSSEIPSSSESEYKYYDQLSFSNCAFTNDKVYKGSLAIVNVGGGSANINESELANIASVRNSDVYGLKDYSLVAYEDAILNIEKLVVAFYNEVPDNDLTVWNGYVPADELSSDGADIDLASGYSIQFVLYRNGGSSQSFSDDEYSFLHDQAPQYGVIERYPEGKNAYTGFEHDPSIYRYVGLPHSLYMKRYNYCLEEYIDKIRNDNIIEFEVESNSGEKSEYVVYYVPKSTTSNTTYVPVPVGGEYKYVVSGDGSDGFIVTVKIA